MFPLHSFGLFLSPNESTIHIIFQANLISILQFPFQFFLHLMFFAIHGDSVVYVNLHATMQKVNRQLLSKNVI